jgi:hypothetical protein
VVIERVVILDSIDTKGELVRFEHFLSYVLQSLASDLSTVTDLLKVDTIMIQGLDLAMYLSETSLASCCCPGGKKSASSISTKDTSDNPLIASR